MRGVLRPDGSHLVVDKLTLAQQNCLISLLWRCMKSILCGLHLYMCRCSTVPLYEDALPRPLTLCAPHSHSQGATGTAHTVPGSGEHDNPRNVKNTRARAASLFLTPSLPYSVIEDKARKQCEHEITERNNSKGVYKQYSDLFITACQAAMETIKNITGTLFPLDLFTDMAYSYANVPLFPIFTTVHYILTACALRKEPGKPVICL